MKVPKRIFPDDYIIKVNMPTAQTESLPFYIKECGYCDKRKFSIGNNNSYDDYLLLYSLSGVVRFSKQLRTQYVHPDNVIVSCCNTPLTFTRTTRRWSFFYIIMKGVQAKKYYNLLRTPTSIIPTNFMSPILDYFIEAISVDYSMELYSDMKASVIVHNLLFELYTIANSILATKAITPVQETVVNQSIKYISKNYKKDLSIDSICEEMNFSKFYFCRLFKEHMGTTVHQYVNGFRVNKSKELLTYSKLSISAVATSVGFKNTLTYSRAFKKDVHMTPTEYRRNF